MHTPARGGLPHVQCWGRNQWRNITITLLVALVASAALVGYGRYELTHDLPNPFWATFVRTYRYVPGTTTPPRALYDVRPDEVVHSYIEDYRALAGTYPCAQDQAHYDDGPDPVLQGKPCLVRHPLTSLSITSVKSLGWSNKGPFTTVSVQLDYTDGTQWTTFFLLQAGRYRPYLPAYTHQTCWVYPDMLDFYSNVTSHVPRGITHVKDMRTLPWDYLCTP